jgi:signal transduction histidine kinase
LSDKKRIPTRGIYWRGFFLQLFVITVLPLTVLLLIVAFGSQTLHHDAMRSLVGDRDLRAVQAAASSLERELSHRASLIQIAARSLGGKTDFLSLILQPDEVSSIYDGGLALFTANGLFILSTNPAFDWQTVFAPQPDYLKSVQKANGLAVFSKPFSFAGGQSPLVMVGSLIDQQEILVGAFNPTGPIQAAVSSLVSIGQTTVLAISPGEAGGGFKVLYRVGPFKPDESASTHPGIQGALNGETGIDYYHSDQGEHVVAFSPIQSTGWGLIIEEAWEDITNPYLNTTQYAPLVIVPVFLLALVALWFGARRIVKPLQDLEKQAAGLADGNFDAIQNPVGGIGEIRNLQNELIDMATRLKAAQQSLRSYIGAITAGVENERRSLARELHDDTIQSLIALNQRIQLASMNSPQTQNGVLLELQSLLQETMTNLRRMIRGLRPIYLEDLGLVASLEMLVRETEKSAAIPISFDIQGTERRLDPQKEMMLYRMVQESLNNVVHHAEAAQAWVGLVFTDTNLTIQVRDNGKGFVVPSNPVEFPGKGHFGLLGLHERAEIINAHLDITSKLDQGTTVTIQTLI